ncbi:MAG: peroxiredoxin family protein [Gammaproteobacteria bacterium]|nr:peroxiredoxin family protein [Gammaproteobacteria bacterium]
MSVALLETVTLQTSSYQEYKLGRALMRRKATLLIFPGAWDPYSVHALKVLRNVESELAAMDVQIIAVTADSPLKIKELLDEHDIPFVVASDPELQVAQRFGMTETVDNARRAQLKPAGVDEVQMLPTLNLLFFREDGVLEYHWRPNEAELLISQERVKEMAAHLHMPPPVQ